jgi:hypothetical protein
MAINSTKHRILNLSDIKSEVYFNKELIFSLSISSDIDPSTFICFITFSHECKELHSFPRLEIAEKVLSNLDSSTKIIYFLRLFSCTKVLTLSFHASLSSRLHKSNFYRFTL